MNEFELIARFFSDVGAKRTDVALGVGDDAALLECQPGEQLVATIDTLVEGRHFPAGSPAASIGHRALAVNLSDLAAMGARPAWALLALTLPRADAAWLTQFASGFAKLAGRYDVALVGGNTTSGLLSVSVQLLGHVPSGKAMLRSGGNPGDILFVSGTPGDAAAGLVLEQKAASAHNAAGGAYASASGEHAAAGGARGAAVAGAEDHLRERFLYPTPRVELGLRLREFASACIDVSDGLFGDASKLAAASGCGMRIYYEQLPVSPQLLTTAGDEAARHRVLSAGEDYELCFSVSPGSVTALERALPPTTWGYTRIGELTADTARRLVRDGNVIEFSHSGFDHFGA